MDRFQAGDSVAELDRDFNVPALWNISIHEVYPGHFLHFHHLRQVTSKVRKSRFFAAASFSATEPVAGAFGLDFVTPPRVPFQSITVALAPRGRQE